MRCSPRFVWQQQQQRVYSGVAAALVHNCFRGNWNESHISDVYLLLIMRAKAPGAGLWSFPGGRLEFGENLVHAAQRELVEETNVQGTTIHYNKSAIFHVSEAIVARDGSYLSGKDPQAYDSVAFHYVLPHVALQPAADSLPCADKQTKFPASTPSDDAAASAWISMDTLLRAAPIPSPASVAAPSMPELSPLCFTQIPTTGMQQVQINDAHTLGGDVLHSCSQPLVRGLPQVVSKLANFLQVRSD